MAILPEDANPADKLIVTLVLWLGSLLIIGVTIYECLYLFNSPTK